MEKKLEIAGKILLVGATAYILAKLYKQFNDGVGLFLSQAKMGEYIVTSKYTTKPITKEEYYKITQNAEGEDVSWKWAYEQKDKDWLTAWYKAVWKASKGKGAETFIEEDVEYFTYGGGKKG
jgi:hypothetical protein